MTQSIELDDCIGRVKESNSFLSFWDLSLLKVKNSNWIISHKKTSNSKHLKRLLSIETRAITYQKRGINVTCEFMFEIRVTRRTERWRSHYWAHFSAALQVKIRSHFFFLENFSILIRNLNFCDWVCARVCVKIARFFLFFVVVHQTSMMFKYTKVSENWKKN